MVESWFIVAIMAGIYSDGTKDVFIFQQPKDHGHFHSAKECTEFVRKNPVAIIGKLVQQYEDRPLERVLCVPEKNVEKFVTGKDINDLLT